MATATATTADRGAAACPVQTHRTPFGSEERHRLLLENMPEVRHIARRIYGRLPAHVPFDDLVHSGVLGLIDAVDKFNPTKKASLRSYAQIRIRGAILDSLRQLDWSPRSLRRQARRIEQAHSELLAKLGRAPSEPEVAAHLDLQLNEFQRLLTHLHNLSVGTWQEAVEERPPIQSNRLCEDPFQVCLRTETTRMMAEAIAALRQKERQVLALYYFEELTMKEVGTILNINESRVSQIVAGALDRLRERLQQCF